MKGQGRGAYYVPSEAFRESVARESGMEPRDSGKLSEESGKAIPESEDATPQELYGALPGDLQQRVNGVGAYAKSVALRRLIADLCGWRPLTASQLAGLLQRSKQHLEEYHLSPMLADGQLEYTFPDMPRHPRQAYRKP